MQIVIAALLSVCGLFVLNHIANRPFFLRLSAFEVTLSPYIDDVRLSSGKVSRVYENYLYYVDRFREM